MRQRISSRIRPARFLFLLIGLGLIIGIVLLIISKSSHQTGILTMSLFLVPCGVLYYWFENAKTVEFDDESLYITGVTGEEKVPLKSVLKMRMTLILINKRNVWEIEYREQDGAKKSVRILPRRLYQHFDEFKYKLMTLSKDVKFEDRSRSIEFDQ